MDMKKLTRFNEQIEKVKADLLLLGPMRPGSLSVQSRRSRDKKLYGAYWHLTWTAQGKVHTQYVPKHLMNQARQETGNYRRFRRLIERLVGLSIKRSLHLMATAKSPAVKK
jgi:hypothetical protein